MLSFGGFLNSSFWSSYKNPASQTIENLLWSKDCSVEKLLEDDDCLQEFKNLNEKLIQYFDHEQIKKLIDLITVMPQEDTQLRGHKLPFIASEIFNCEINQILDKFFDYKEVKKETATSDQEDSVEESQDKEDQVSKEEDRQAQEKLEKEKSEEPQNKEDEEKVEGEEAKVEGEESKQEDQEKKETSDEKEEEKKEEATVETQDTQEEAQKEDAEEKKEASEVEKTTQEESTDKNIEVSELDQGKKETEEAEEQKVAATSAIVEPEDEDSTIKKNQQPPSRYLLLDRLFNFIRTDDKPLNPVLSGYFAKLVTLLINRKQKNLIPYVFSPESDVIDRLLFHVYQKSISELLNKFLNILDSDFESDIGSEMQKKQTQIAQSLLSKLSSEASEEDNLNGASIIQDLLEIKEFYAIACKRQNLSVLMDYVLNEEGTTSSRTASATILATLASLYHDKHKGSGTGSKKRSDQNNDDDDEITVQHSDEEEGDASSPIDNPLVELLKENIEKFSQILGKSVPKYQIENCYDSSKQVPLGSFRLKIVELVLYTIKLHKKDLYERIVDTKILTGINELLSMYPWNNFLQLKVIAIYEEIFENSESSQYRRQLLESSNIGQTVIHLGKSPNYAHESSRNFRNGFMAAVIKLGNFLNKYSDKEDVQQYIQSLGDDWTEFVEGELKRSNETNNKSLGDQKVRPSIGDDDDDNNTMEVNMEKIMQRFSNFSALVSSNSEDDDDDDEEEKTKNDHDFKDADKENDEDDMFSHLQTQEVTESQLPEPVKLEQDYIDSNYWKPLTYLNQSIDDLIASEFK